MKKKLSITKKILFVILILIISIVATSIFTLNHYMSKIERVEIDRSVVTETGKEPAKEDKNLITIALLGADLVKTKNMVIFMVLQILL